MAGGCPTGDPLVGHGKRTAAVLLADAFPDDGDPTPRPKRVAAVEAASRPHAEALDAPIRDEYEVTLRDWWLYAWFQSGDAPPPVDTWGEYRDEWWPILYAEWTIDQHRLEATERGVGGVNLEAVQWVT